MFVASNTLKPRIPMPNIDHQFEQSRMKSLIPVRDLQVDSQAILVSKSRIIRLQVGEELVANDYNDSLLYLLEGKIGISLYNQSEEIFTQDDERALHPVFIPGEFKSRVMANAFCRLICFDRTVFNNLLTSDLISSPDSQSKEVDFVETNLFNSFMLAFNAGKLELPSLPDIALKVRNAASDPDVSIDEIVRIIEADPAMAARLIQVANSPINKTTAPIRGIRDTIMRLGLLATRNLVLGLAMKQLFKADNPMLIDRMHELYEHSIEVAAICYAIGRRVRHPQQDYLLLAGLVHDIGVIPIIAHIESTGLLIDSREELEGVIQKLRGTIGAMVVRDWGLPPDLVIVAEQAEQWSRKSGDKPDVCDMVIIAQIYSMLQHRQLQNMPKMEDVPAFQKLFHGKPDSEFAQQVLNDAHDEVQEVMRLLKI